MSGDWLQRQKFTTHSGLEANFKIECDHLTEEEIATFAILISNEITFSAVYGIPRGGTRIADALRPYADRDSPYAVIVDDVLTTGFSMEEARVQKAREGKYPFHMFQGVVLFARGRPPRWISPVFQLMVGRLGGHGEADR
jgi:MoxR-like ATPase